MNGDSPVDVLKWQILKYQFPSAYSLSRNIDVSLRFRIHPFVFLFRLLADRRIGTLSEKEAAKIVVVEAESESEKCFERVVSRLLEFRERGSAMPVSNMIELIKRHGERNYSHSRLKEIFSIGRQVLYSDIE